MKNFYYNLSVLNSRISEFLSGENPLHPERFCYPHELVKFSADKPSDYGLLLGLDEFGRYLQITTHKNRKQLGNVLRVIATQGGKSNGFKHEGKHWKGSFIGNDIKGGEIDVATSDIRAEFSDIYRIDLTGGGNKFDPLMGKETEDDLYDIAKLLLYEPNEHQPAFTQRGIEILTILFLAAKVPPTPIPPFLFVREVAQLGINGAAKRLNEISPPLAKRFLDGDYSESKNYSENTYLENSWASAKARLQPFLTENVVKSFSGSDFRIADLLTGERPITIYLKWPESKLFALRPVMRLLWWTFTNELRDTYDAIVLSKGVKYALRHLHRILFQIDEAGVTPVPELQDAIATFNGRGMSFDLGIQSLSQLEHLYGRANAETILDNCTQVYGQQSSLATAKYVSELLGGKSAFSSSLSHGEETSKHEQKVPLMTPQEIRGMDDTILVFDKKLRYAIKAKRLPEFVKPEVAFDDPPLLSPIPEIPLLPAPRVDTWRRASEAYPLVFAEREMSDGTTLGL